MMLLADGIDPNMYSPGSIAGYISLVIVGLMSILKFRKEAKDGDDAATEAKRRTTLDEYKQIIGNYEVGRKEDKCTIEQLVAELNKERTEHSSCRERLRACIEAVKWHHQILMRLKVKGVIDDVPDLPDFPPEPPDRFEEKAAVDRNANSALHNSDLRQPDPPTEQVRAMK